jgi:hypothetical protein
MKFLVRQRGDKPDLFNDAVNASSAVEAAELFMERVEHDGDLSEWIESGNQVELLVREIDSDQDIEVSVTVDWDPMFIGHEKITLPGLEQSRGGGAEADSDAADGPPPSGTDASGGGLSAVEAGSAEPSGTKVPSHTPGPWVYERGGVVRTTAPECGVKLVRGIAFPQIALVTGLNEERPEHERDANGYLVAASTELLRTVRCSLDFLEEYERTRAPVHPLCNADERAAQERGFRVLRALINKHREVIATAEGKR